MKDETIFNVSDTNLNMWLLRLIMISDTWKIVQLQNNLWENIFIFHLMQINPLIT